MVWADVEGNEWSDEVEATEAFKVQIKDDDNIKNHENKTFFISLIF